MSKEIEDGLEDLKTKVKSIKKSLGVLPKKRIVKKKKITVTDYNKQMDKILSNKRKKVYTLSLEAFDFASGVEIVDDKKNVKRGSRYGTIQ